MRPEVKVGVQVPGRIWRCLGCLELEVTESLQWRCAETLLCIEIERLCLFSLWANSVPDTGKQQ